MSSVLTFVYDYQSASDIVRNICLKGAKVGKANMDNTYINFYGGYIGFKDGGKSSLQGILFNFVLDDFKRFKQFTDLQYETKIVDVVVKQNTQIRKVKTFVPVTNKAMELPDPLYYEKLVVTYGEHNFDIKILERALARTFLLNYPEMRKYKLIERREPNGGKGSQDRK